MNPNSAIWLAAAAASGGGAVAWSPSDLSPPCWLDPGAGHSAADGGDVSPWSNQGTEPLYDISQGTVSARFTYDAVDVNMNNQPSMLLDGGDRLVSPVGAHWETADGGDQTTIIFLRQNVAAAQVIMSGGDNTTGFQIRTRDGGASWQRYEDTAGGLLQCNGGSITSGVLRVYAIVVKGAVTPGLDTIEFWLDGVLAASATADRGAFAGTPVGGQEFIVGSHRVVSGSFSGNLGHILQFPRQLTSGEDASLTSWANGLYGTSWAGITQ